LTEDLSNSDVDEDKITNTHIKEQSKNSAVISYLIFALECKAFDLVTTEMINNVLKAWKLLMDDYEPSDKEASINLQEEFTKLKLGEKENQKCMITNAKQMNKQFRKGTRKYHKDDIELITMHLLARLPYA
jgi:hypothetical protein